MSEKVSPEKLREMMDEVDRLPKLERPYYEEVAHRLGVRQSDIADCMAGQSPWFWFGESDD